MKTGRLGTLLFLATLVPPVGAQPLPLDNAAIEVEALAEFHAAQRVRPDVATYTALLRALQAAGSPMDLAMSAEEAVARHPKERAFVWTAIEALLAVKAPERAMKYWDKLPRAEKNTSRGLWLLGAIHENNGATAQAYQAYQTAAQAEPEARKALARLAAHSLLLDGQRYFPPPGWSVEAGSPPQLLDMQNGMRATLTYMGKTKPLEAVRLTLSQALPVSINHLNERLAPAKRNAPNGTKGQAAPEPIQVEWLACAGGNSLVCLEAGPDKDFPDSLPTLYLAALHLRAGTLVLVLEGASRNQAPTVLRTLADARRLAEEDKP
ncbi:MAG: hypothetical protein Q8O33_05375 [Pseudomonadota bacterium]|nr:hypothetical protein [Pseudomonadota bacterium]